MWDVILWYLIVTLVGWLVFPLAYRLLHKLPDRGLTFLRPLGLLVWGFVYWILASFGFLKNGTGEVILVLFLVGGLSYWFGRGRWSEMRDWLRMRMGMVVIIEIIFLISMIYMAIMRAGSPDITGTEKPMELAFINAILRSPGMPPQDPWLAGYGISYYYFGYLMVAMLARVSGVAGGIAFNLAIALWFAMTAVAAYGVALNLLARDKKDQEDPVQQDKGKPARKGMNQPHALALLAPIFILVLSNLGGLLEVLHANGTFWERGEDGQLTSPFWQGLKIKEWEQPPAEPFAATIKRGGWWWWRSSRVLQDFRLNGDGVEVIDEFPQFSYILADLHPHVLSVPFSLLVIGLIFNFYLEQRKRTSADFSLISWVRTAQFWLTAIIVGALGFLNVWDFPIYLVVFGMVFALVQYWHKGWQFWKLLVEMLKFILVLALAGILVYFPFYLGFSSQAGPPYFYLSLSFFTPGANFWIMFATLLAPLFFWLAWTGKRSKLFARENSKALWNGLAFGAVLVFGLWALSYLIGLVLVIVLQVAPEFSAFGQQVGQWFYFQQGSQDGFAILGQSFIRRLAQPGTWLTLFALLAIAWGAIGAWRRNIISEHPQSAPTGLFVLIMTLAGAGLTLFPEFFFLKDDFGARMNTVFKFYYQTWIMWAIVAAFGTAVLLTRLRFIGRMVFSGLLLLVMMAGLIYPMFGFLDRMSLLDGNDENDFKLWGLDGTAYMKNYHPNDWEAIQFLQTAPDGVVLEAVGGQYSQYARIATLTGLQNVLGWPGHEGQWRGTRVNFYPRVEQVKLAYETSDWLAAKAIFDLYDVRYIYIGDLERTTYKIDEEKFIGKLPEVFANNSVKIYEYVP